ncbi:flagellar biosynthesis anti-sigma factor FlgM [Glacieibacterium sp.]|uniref:flagellar biosynthesis anti-sigma factor FlgM n=1 Tax=Glacieibacterium sp. TaxID=2860237 RepID=UPI003AFF8DD7
MTVIGNGLGGIGATLPVDAAAVKARQAAVSAAPTRASEPLNLSGTAVAARALAQSPPVDAGKVAALRTAIASGSYAIDPGKIAEKMVALDLPAPRGD